VERVEVLRDGASAIYRSDAIAGVINFIIRQDYNGAQATAYYGAPTRSGGGSQWQGSPRNPARAAGGWRLHRRRSNPALTRIGQAYGDSWQTFVSVVAAGTR
jgi:outer membrane receptor protein involved in Fe transport